MFIKQKKNKGHNEVTAYICHLFSALGLSPVMAVCLAAGLLIVLLAGLASHIKAQTAIFTSPCQIYFPESLGSPITILTRGMNYEFTLMEMSYNAGEDYEDRWLFSPFALGREVDLPRAGDPVFFPFHTMNSAGKGSLTIIPLWDV